MQYFTSGGSRSSPSMRRGTRACSSLRPLEANALALRFAIHATRTDLTNGIAARQETIRATDPGVGQRRSAEHRIAPYQDFSSARLRGHARARVPRLQVVPRYGEPKLVSSNPPRRRRQTETELGDPFDLLQPRSRRPRGCAGLQRAAEGPDRRSTGGGLPLPVAWRLYEALLRVPGAREGSGLVAAAERSSLPN